eukprot:gene19164-27145_t
MSPHQQQTEPTTMQAHSGVIAMNAPDMAPQRAGGVAVLLTLPLLVFLLLTLLVPIVGLTTGWLVFDEALRPIHFAGGALLQMEMRQGDGQALACTLGREAIAETLVRNFGRAYENAYTFCLTDPPAPVCTDFHCLWLSAMTAKDNRAVCVTGGQYHWRFAPGNRLAQELRIVVDTMQTLPPADILP